MFSQNILFYFGYFEELLTLEYLLLKIEVWSQGVDVARWVRPAIEHTQGTVGFLFLVMLLFYDLWCLVSCVGSFGLVYNSFPTGLKESLKLVIVC